MRKIWGIAAVMLALAAPVSAGEVEGFAAGPSIAPEQGFIELAIADDGAGRVAFAVADAGDHAEVRVVEVATGTELRRFDVSPLTTQPTRLAFVGDAVFVVGPPPEGEGVVGALFDAAGQRGKKTFGPADVVAIHGYKGKPAVVVKTVTPAKKGGELHTVERFDPVKGRRIGKPRRWTFVGGREARLGFVVNHWTRDGFVAVGTQEGTYSKKEDMRMPDAEGRLDLLDAKKAETAPITDLIGHGLRFQLLAREGGPTTFARIADDLTGVELWRDDRKTVLELDQKFVLYDPQSLAHAVGADGTVWLGLAIDPWNRPAVDRKKADKEYFDVFRVAGTKATRVGRVLAPKKRFAIGAAAGHVWLLERNVGFSRGGKRLSFYKLP